MQILINIIVHLLPSHKYTEHNLSNLVLLSQTKILSPNEWHHCLNFVGTFCKYFYKFFSHLLLLCIVPISNYFLCMKVWRLAAKLIGLIFPCCTACWNPTCSDVHSLSNSLQLMKLLLNLLWSVSSIIVAKLSLSPSSVEGWVGYIISINQITGHFSYR